MRDFFGRRESTRLLAFRPAAYATAALSLTYGAAVVSAQSPATVENHTTMAAMMSAMKVAPSDDVDSNFVAMMVQHHLGAIDMARTQLRYGHSAQLRRMAEEIIVTQQDEIVAMQRALDTPRFTASEVIPVSHRDRVYAAEQFSNTVSVTDPADNRLLGVIRLGDPVPGNLSPLYRGQLLVHGLGASPDHHTLAAVSIGSNSVTFIDTRTNAKLHVTYVGRSPHEAFYTPDGKEVWVTVRGEDYVSVIDANTYEEKLRIHVPDGPGMQIFSPDGAYAYVCSSLTPQTVVVSVPEHKIVGRVAQASPFCPNIAASPDGDQVWFTLKDVGKVMVFQARPPFAVLKTIDVGPIANHVNVVHTANGTFAYVTVGALNEVQVFRTSDFAKIATVHVGSLPHGLWPSGDGTRVYVGLENDDELAVIDTKTNRLIDTIPIGQAPQAVIYVPNAVAEGDSARGLEPLGKSAGATHIRLVATSRDAANSGNAKDAPTSVTLFDQGLVQVLEAGVSGLAPKQKYVLGLASRADGSGPIAALASFTTSPVGSAVVNAVGPIRQVVHGDASEPRRYFVIVAGTTEQPGAVVQIQGGVR